MKQNYNLLTSSTAFPHAWNTFFQKSKKHAGSLLVVLFTFLGFSDAFGQVANYTFSESAGTYTTITGTTAIASGWDDTVTANTIPIGFTFNFNGTNYTTCSINSNGYITFGATISANNLYTPISGTTGYNGAISGFGVDLRDDINTRNIRYTTTGTAPNRIFTVQWREARRFAEAGNLDFQIKLFETSNRIDIVYANFALDNNNVNVQVGLRGANNTDFNNRSLTAPNTAWDGNTTAGGANNATCRSRNNNQPSNGRTFTWTPPTPPTITSLGAASGCVGSTLTINGTNLLTATAVTIGGTAATITGTTATSVTVTVGTGTTGTIQVTTPGGTATSAATFTVNTGPIITTQPVATSICTTGTGTFTVVATGATTYQWRRNGVNLTNTAPYSGVNTATLTITNPAAVNAGNFDVIVGNGSCTTTSSLAALTVTSVPNIVATPTPANGATGVCYSGFGAITAISWAASAGATNYDVYFGAGSLPGGITATVTTNSYTFGALTPNTTYYWRIVAKNACGDAPTSATFSFTTSTEPICYCTPTTTQNTEYISGVASVGTINDVSNPSGYTAGGYANYSSIIIATQIPGGGVNIDINFNPTGELQFIKTWVDWNKNGIFENPAELVYTTGTTATGPTSFGFIIPGAQALGDYRMRIKTRNLGGPFSGNSTYTPCSNHARGETEDYTIRVVADCSAKITGVTNGSACGPTNTVNLSATMSAGSTQIRWYTTLTGGAPIHTGTTFTTPTIATTTTYYVTAWNGTCETYHRTPVIATILPTSNITVTPSVPEVCGEGNVVQITATGDFLREILFTQNFESGMAPFTVTTPLNVNGGADTPWSVKTSPYQPTTTSAWKPAVNSGPVGTTGNRFAFTTSDYSSSTIQTVMTSPVIDATLFNSLTLTFDHYYSAYAGDSGEVQVATDAAGTNWTTAIAPSPFNTDLGSASKFTTATVDLTPYAGISTLRFRFVYNGTWDDGWAIDNIKLEGIKPLNTNFTWTGGSVEAFTDAACLTPYVSQSVTTVYVRPTPMQLASPSWSFTANATLGNGCTIAQPITINNKTKLWKGTSDNNWYNPNNWEPVGVPDANTCVYIYPGSPAANTSNINTIANDGFAKSVTVRPSGVLNIHPGNDLTVTDAVTVDAGGTFNIENTGSLIQVNNVANSGIISMKRNVNIRQLDYVYWSSPVANFASSAVSPLTPTGFIYKWAPTLGGTVNNHGNWVGGNEAMVNGRGYIVRGPSTYTSTLQNFTANFVGVPNNGNITIPVSRETYNGGTYNTLVSTTLGTADDDNWNLLGNPYPSAISANTFLATNTNLAGFIKFWTHGTLPSAAISDPFYNNYVQNYTVADYVTYNATGANPPIGNGNIAAGQGFFVLMNHTSAATTENVVFNNSMRRNDYRNDNFFRNSNTTNSENEEKHRIWLNLISPASTSTTTLVGYISGATNELDRMYDAPALDVKTNFELYSFSNTDKLNIQGKSLPFNDTDQIPLGISIAQNGTHTLGISTVDGLFESASQGIYLEDRNLGITHDLRVAPYSFTATTGRFENRFVLKFNNETLGNEDFTANTVMVYANDNINVIATNQTIKSVRVYDLLGRVLGTFNNIDATAFSTKNVAKTQSPLLVEVTLSNGTVVSKKAIY